MLPPRFVRLPCSAQAVPASSGRNLCTLLGLIKRQGGGGQGGCETMWNLIGTNELLGYIDVVLGTLLQFPFSSSSIQIWKVAVLSLQTCVYERPNWQDPLIPFYPADCLNISGNPRFRDLENRARAEFALTGKMTILIFSVRNRTAKKMIVYRTKTFVTVPEAAEKYKCVFASGWGYYELIRKFSLLMGNEGLTHHLCLQVALSTRKQYMKKLYTAPYQTSP